MKQSIKSGLIILLVGIAIGFAPMIGVYLGDRSAGWALMGSIPVGVIVGLIGLFSMAFGKDAPPDDAGKPQSSEEAGDEKPSEKFGASAPVQVAAAAPVPTQTPKPKVLSSRFGVQQIILMGSAFLLLLLSSSIRLSTQGEYWLAQGLAPLELPKTLGVVVSAVLFVTALRLRINKSKTWSVDAYESLYRAQRAFTIPAYASILLLSLVSPMSWFDPTGVGTEAGLSYNQLMGVTEIAPTVIAIATNTACFWLRSKYNREAGTPQTT